MPRPKGYVCSEETRRKMSEVQRGRPRSEETKRKMSEAKTGRKRGPYRKRQTVVWAPWLLRGTEDVAP